MKTKRIFCFTVLLLLCTAALLYANGGQEKEETVVIEEAVIVQVTGTVRLVGSANFQQIVITGSNSQWYVVGEDMNKLYDLQYRTVTVEGEETVRELGSASGRLSGLILRELRNIKIISIEEYSGP